MISTLPFRDRVVQLQYVRAHSLLAHPMRWKQPTHPQRDALSRLLREIGFVSPIIARRLIGGTLQVIDGHLRAEMAGSRFVPVVIVDVSDDEARSLVMLHDLVGSLAEIPRGKAAQQLQCHRRQARSAKKVLTALRQKAAGRRKKSDARQAANGSLAAENTELSVHHVIVECTSEAHQKAIYDQLTEQNERCRVHTL